MYVRTLGDVSDEEGITYQSEAAERQAAQELFTRYESSCKGIDVLKRLRKEKHSLYDEALLLHRRIRELPQLFQEKADLDRRARIWRDSAERLRVLSDPIAERRRVEEFVHRTRALPPEAYRIELARLLVRLGYPPNYYLRDLKAELRQAKCEDSLNSLRWSGPCGGMEVDDPKHVASQVADHYVRTELGAALSSQRITYSGSGRRSWCDVHFPKGVVIRVNFGKVPYALIAVQLAPKLGPQREYSYWCFRRHVNLRLQATP